MDDDRLRRAAGRQPRRLPRPRPRRPARAAARRVRRCPTASIYLDGNSLGALPRRTAARLAEVTGHEWGEGLIRSWNNAGWIDLSRRIGDKIAALIGARRRRGERRRLDLAQPVQGAQRRGRAAARRRAGAPRRSSPSAATSRPISTSPKASPRRTASSCGWSMATRIADALDDDVAVLMLTHVNYRSGRMHDWPRRRAPRTRPARSSSGTWRTRPARCRSTCTAPTPTSPSAAATST